MPLGLGIWELLILIGVIVLLFGAKGAPAMARRLGTGVRELKDAVEEIDPRKMLEAKDEPGAGKRGGEPEAPNPISDRAPDAVAPRARTDDAVDEPPSS